MDLNLMLEDRPLFEPLLLSTESSNIQEADTIDGDKMMI